MTHPFQFDALFVSCKDCEPVPTAALESHKSTPPVAYPPRLVVPAVCELFVPSLLNIPITQELFATTVVLSVKEVAGEAAVFVAEESGCPVCLTPVYETAPAAWKELDDDKVTATELEPVAGLIR